MRDSIFPLPLKTPGTGLHNSAAEPPAGTAGFCGPGAGAGSPVPPNFRAKYTTCSGRAHVLHVVSLASRCSSHNILWMFNCTQFNIRRAAMLCDAQRGVRLRGRRRCTRGRRCRSVGRSARVARRAARVGRRRSGGGRSAPPSFFELRPRGRVSNARVRGFPISRCSLCFKHLLQKLLMI